MKLFPTISIRLLFLVLACFVTPFMEVAPISAQNTPSPSTGLKSTDELLSQVCNFLKAQPSFTVEMDITYDNVRESGAKVNLYR